MTTGKNNYMQLGRILKGDKDFFVNKPELLETPEYAVKAACEYWKARGAIQIAGLPDDSLITIRKSPGLDVATKTPLEVITKLLTGGYMNMAQRKKYYDIAKQVLQ